MQKFVGSTHVLAGLIEKRPCNSYIVTVQTFQCQHSPKLHACMSILPIERVLKIVANTEKFRGFNDNTHRVVN